MKLLKFLPQKTVGSLIQICRTYNLKNYSGLKKDGLINLINENVNNPQFNEKIQSLIPNNGTTALILKALIDNNNEINYSKLRKEVLLNRSSSAFWDGRQKLMMNFIIFEDETSDDDKLYIPKEFVKFAKKVIDEKLAEESPEEPEKEQINIDLEKEKREIISIDKLLKSRKYALTDTLSDMLKRLGKPYSGNKTELIYRLLYEAEQPVATIINSLFGKNELKEICEDLNLFVSGTKNALIDRILEKFPPEFPQTTIPMKITIEREKIETPKKKALGMSSDVISNKKKNIQVIKTEKEESHKLLNVVYEFLEKVELSPYTKKEGLKSTIYTAIRNSNLKELNNSIINEIPKENHITVEKDGEIVLISVWFIDRKDRINRISYKNMMNKHQNKDFMSYIYDPDGKLNSEEVDAIKTLYKCVHKEKREFQN